MELANAKKVYRKSEGSPSNALSLCAKPLDKDLRKNFPPRKNPEGYGLQPVRKCIHRGPALAAEGSMFPSIQRHHKKNTPHT
jgi:hypothetical protein